MATYSSVTIEFTNDWILGDKLAFSADAQVQSQIFTWVTTRTVAYDVEVGTVTATAGERAAINFKAAFDLDFTSGYTTSITSNEVTITSTTLGEQFYFVGSIFGTGTVTVTITNGDTPKINIRSPYFINIAQEDLTSATIDLYIYTGIKQSTIVESTYSLTVDAINDEVNFEIAQLVSDHLDISYDGTFNSGVVWVNYQVTRYINETAQTADAVIPLLAFDGYGYFEDGANPQLSNRLLQSNTTMYVYDNNYFYIPIQQDYLSQVDLKSNGSIIDTETFTSTTDSADVIRYIGYTNESVCGGVNYLFEDEAGYLFQDGNVFIFTDGGDYIDEILITYSDATTTSVTVKTITENKYTPYRLTFINKFGALQSVWMFKRSDLSISVKNESFRGFLYDSGSYDVSEHQYRNYNLNAKESLTLNSGFYNEDYNEIFKQMVLSEKIWIHYEDNVLPVNLKSKELKFKTSLNNKLIDYKVEFEFAFDKINHVY